MGVPGFFAWILKQYKSHNVISPKISTQPNVLYIDANGLFHPQCQIILDNSSEQDIEIFCINGNHTLLPNQQNKTYYKGLLKDFFKKEYNINVLEYEEVKTPYHKNPFLYCSHGSINRLETLTKNYSVVFSHFRSSNPKDKAIYSDEIDTTILKAKADLVVLGDIHTRLNYDNVVYCGTPICTAFHDK